MCAVSAMKVHQEAVQGSPTLTKQRGGGVKKTIHKQQFLHLPGCERCPTMKRSEMGAGTSPECSGTLLHTPHNHTAKQESE